MAAVAPSAPGMPGGFLWGAATAAHQVEGDNTNSDWWAAESQGRVPVPSGAACGSLQRWPADLDLVAGSGLNAYRFSVEWARVQPAPAEWDDAALRRYVEMAAGCRARGITPLVTLYHFTLPQWVAARGGWRWRGCVPAFRAYVRRVVEAMGDAVDLYATVNEPVVLAIQGYLHGMWPPGRHNPLLAWLVGRRLAAAHRTAFGVIRAVRPQARVGVAQHVIDFRALEPTRRADRLMARLVAHIFNDTWLNAVRRHLDWVGLNYYTTHYCSAGLRRDRMLPELVRARSRHKTEVGWEIHPEGLREMLVAQARLGLPIYVTENGVATPDDDLRRHFLRTHLLAAAEAVAHGVDLRGYFHWSLLDNFEWAEGYSCHFGLVGVERQTLEREIRPSLGYLGSMARTNTVLPLARGRDDAVGG